ncbi:hypothetical protein F0562_035238 [Nyssa sinensis]|uniref:Uncharacterized protein n=1 Tax=Nyssa sinensis TaxID=561372 RepID=A0A5J5AAA2_9ASTE|nr:hypothetical protein F0562_035238 [Nyssa sinensis]
MEVTAAMETKPHMIIILQFHCGFLLLLALLCLGHAVSGTTPPCNGSIAECNEDVEVLMESEISRRFLEQKKYISEGALKPDEPVCNGGAKGENWSSRGEVEAKKVHVGGSRSRCAPVNIIDVIHPGLLSINR